MGAEGREPERSPSGEPEGVLGGAAGRRPRATHRATVTERCGRGVVAVTTASRDYGLGQDFGQLREDRKLADLFRAHTSPAFLYKSLLTAGLDPSGGSSSSLANCKQLPMSDEAAPEPSGNSSENGEKPFLNTPPQEEGSAGYVSDATEVIRASISRSRERQRKALALIEEGEVAHAKRLVNCNRQSVQLECPTMAGGCGSDDNYVPISCESRLCPDCMRQRQGRLAEKYASAVESWDSPVMFRVGLPKRVEPTREDITRAVDALRGAFGSLRRRVIPPEGEHNGKRWVWKADGGEPADHYWKQSLIQAGRHDLARRWQKRYVNQGKGIPFEEIARAGFYGIDLKQGDDRTVNVHVHVLADVPYLPQAALASVWDELIGAPVTDIRRVEERGEQDAESALMEVVGYAAKPPEFQEAEDEAAYYAALKGSRLVQPFGELHGNAPDVFGLLRCCDCEQAPRWWNQQGIVDGQVSTAIVGGSAGDGDRPPPGGGHEPD